MRTEQQLLMRFWYLRGVIDGIDLGVNSGEDELDKYRALVDEYTTILGLSKEIEAPEEGEAPAEGPEGK